MQTMTNTRLGSTAEPGWEPGPRARPLLHDGALHVWRADLGHAPDDALGLLSPGELARAATFVDVQKGRRWAHSRRQLRMLLGRYLGCPPQDLRFVTGEHGKPALEMDPDAASASRHAGPISFNVSHSDDVALFAFSSIGPVGIDIETRTRQIDELGIAARFGLPEQGRLAELDGAQRRREFLRAWVRFEAGVKQRGSRLSDGASQGAGSLWLTALDVGPDRAAAVAVARRPSELRCWSLGADGLAAPRSPARPARGQG